MTKRSDHTGAIERAEQILCQPTGSALDLSGEPSLVIAHVLLAVLCDDEYTFVTKDRKMKWNIRQLARFLGIEETRISKAVKSCTNARLYDSSGFRCYAVQELRELKTPRMVALRSLLLDTLREQKVAIQLLPSERNGLSKAKRETLRQLMLADYPTRVVVCDVLSGKQPRLAVNGKLLQQLEKWHRTELQLLISLLV
jgi:hypothetical protein